MTTPLTKLKNLGPKAQAYCAEIGVLSAEDFMKTGYMPIYLAIAGRYKHMRNRMALYAFYGAYTNHDCVRLPQEIKDQLEVELQAALKKAPYGAADGLNGAILHDLP